MAHVRCDSCQTTLEIEAAYVGRPVQCGACGAEFTAREDPAADPGGHSEWGDDTPGRQGATDGGEYDDYDARPRRRAAYRDADNPADRAYGPGLALLIAAIFGFIFRAADLAITLVVGKQMFQGGLFGGPANPAQAQFHYNLAVGADVLFIIMNMVIIVGSFQMMRARSYSLSMATTLMSLIPCVGCCVLPVNSVFAVWGLVVLCDADVRAAFDGWSPRRPSDRTYR